MRISDWSSDVCSSDLIGDSVDAPIYAASPNPLDRRLIDRPLSTGVRAIDATMTTGEGQRVGIFAVAGGGKSTLLGMLARGGDADVNVIRSEAHTSELQSLMRISYAVSCLKKQVTP